MMDGPIKIYLFRSDRFAPGGDTVVCAAPVDLVVAAYGGGGDRDQEGTQRAFGGSAFYRNETTGECFLGVWGLRNASRFRAALRRKVAIIVVREPPPARLAWWSRIATAPPTSA